MTYVWTEERRELQRRLGKERLAMYPNLFVDAIKGHPKSPEQKAKMRAAKLGVPKTEEHKAAMAYAHRLRHRVIDEIMHTQGLEYKAAVKELKTNKAHYYQAFKDKYSIPATNVAPVTDTGINSPEKG